MANIVFRATLKDQDALRGLQELGRAGQTGIARALKRTGTSGRATLARLVGKDTGLGVETVKKEITTSLSLEEGTVRLITAGTRIPLIRFGARGPQPTKGRKGSGVSAIRFGQRHRYEGAFLATVKGPLPSGVVSPGHFGVFRRARTVTRKSVGAWGFNLPIRQLYGPSIAHVFGKFLPEAAEQGMQTLGKNLEHELQFALSRR